MGLENRVVVVTGAAGLLGREHCVAVAEAGGRVVATDRDESAVQAVVRTLPHPEAHLAVAADVTDKSAVEGLRDAVLAQFDRLDGLVNNAAINDMFESPQAAAEQSKFENYPLELWQRSLDVNLTGVFLCCQVLGSAMVAQGGGAVVNIASTYGVVAPDQSLYRAPDGTQRFFKSAAYPTTKAGVLGLTRFLGAYWGAAGVRVNALSPGGVENGQDAFFSEKYGQRTPLGRMAQPDDYRGSIVFLLSDASRYMTGANLVVDGGWTAW